MTRTAVRRWLQERRSPLARTERMLWRRSWVLQRRYGDRAAVEHYAKALETAAVDLRARRLSSQ